MTEAGTQIGSGGTAPLPRSLPERHAYRGPEERLERLHAYFLEGCTDEIRPVLGSVLADARRVHAGYADDEVGDGLASVWYAATAIVELGAALELDEADVRGAGAAIAEACALPLSAARYVLFREVVGHPRLLELPPLLAIELQLGLLLGLDVLSDVSLWTRTPGGLDCLVTLGGEGASEPAHARGGEGDTASEVASLAARWLAAPVGDRAPLRRVVRRDRRASRLSRASRR